MPETWTAPRTWTNGETVTETILNTHVRDNLLYLKGVLSGSNLQDVLIANDRNLQWKDSAGVAQSVMKGSSDDYLNLIPLAANRGIRFMNKAYTQEVAKIIESSYSVLLKNGQFRTHRHGQSNDRHICAGRATFGAISGGASASVSVTFTPAYASTPAVAVGTNSQTGGNIGLSSSWASNVSTSGCDIYHYAGPQDTTASVVGWIAEGQSA